MGPGAGNHDLGNKQHNECCNVNPRIQPLLRTGMERGQEPRCDDMF